MPTRRLKTRNNPLNPNNPRPYQAPPMTPDEERILREDHVRYSREQDQRRQAKEQGLRDTWRTIRGRAGK